MIIGKAIISQVIMKVEILSVFLNLPDLRRNYLVKLAVSQSIIELRTMVVLFYVEDLSIKIAEIMKCPVGTVMSRLFMARQCRKRK